MDLSKTQIEQIISSTQQLQMNENILVRCMKNEQTANVVIKSLNRALSKAETFNYLKVILLHCSSTILKENALIWINFCLSTKKLSGFRFNILATTLDLSSNIDELHKEIAKNYVPKIINVCLEARVKRAESADVLVCLRQCLTKYSCSHYSKQIEELLLTYLHEELPLNVVKEASVCFHHLQQVGFPGLNSKNYSTNWSKQMDKLCTTIHNLYDVFLQQETENFSSSTEGFDLPEVPLNFNETQRLHLYMSRLTNCIIFTKTLLETEFNAAKEVHPRNILWVVQRGFSEHRCIGKIDSLVMAHHSILLNRLQVNLLFLLRSLLACLGEHILIFSFDITKIFMDCILIMETCECLQIDMKFQKTFYTVLNFWLPIVKNQLNDTYQNKLLKYFIARLQPVKQEITLSLSQNNHKSKKAKKKAMTERTIAGLKPSCVNETTGEETQTEHTCNYILDSLKQLLICVHLNVKSETLKELYSLLTTLATDIQIHTAAHPYTDEIVQRKVHEVLVALFEQPNLTQPPPIKLCITLFMNGQNLPHISYICTRGVNVLEKIAQPVCPSLYVYHNDREKVVDGNCGNGKKINILDICVIPPPANKERPLLSGDDGENVTKSTGGDDENDVIVAEIEEDVHHSECNEIIHSKTDEEVLDVSDTIDDQMEDDENSVVVINDSITADDNESEATKLEVITVEDVNIDSPPNKKSKKDEEITDCNLEDAMDSFVDEMNDY